MLANEEGKGGGRGGVLPVVMELLTNALLAALPAYLEGLPLPPVLGVDGVRGGNNAIPTFVDIKVKYVVGECLLRLYSNSSVGVDGCLVVLAVCC